VVKHAGAQNEFLGEKNNQNFKKKGLKLFKYCGKTYPMMIYRKLSIPTGRFAEPEEVSLLNITLLFRENFSQKKNQSNNK